MKEVCKNSLSIVLKMTVAIVLIVSGWQKVEASEDQTFSLTENTFVLAASQPLDAQISKFWDMVFTEVFKRLDFKLHMKFYPMARASHEADMGNVDGETERIYQYADAHPNLVRVEESLSPLDIAAYASISSNIPELNGWESLRETDYKVEYTHGLKFITDNLSEVVKKENLSTITTATQGLKQLAVGRIDIYVGAKVVVIPLLQNPELGFHGKIRNVGIMGSTPKYLYVHKKHRGLAPRLAEIIKSLKAEGLIEKYWNIAFGNRNDIGSTP